MRCHLSAGTVLAIGLAALSLAACGSKAGSGAGGSAAGSAGAAPGGKYSAVNGDPITFEFSSGGAVTATLGDVGSSKGTYTVDGEKLIVSLDGQTHTFIRDGNCIEEPLHVFGKLCKGGKAGEASNVSTRSVPTMPAGVWIANNADGEFRLEFRPDNKLTITATPTGGKPDIQEGTFTVEGDEVHATVGQGVPLVLKFVNNNYESTSFGLPLTFVRQ